MALCAARGVNLLLNVGPTPEGNLVPEETERLTAVGKWMDVNGDSIYGTTCSPVDFDYLWGAMTQKDQTVYLHVLEWKADGIEFNGLVGQPSKAYLLADPEKKPLPVVYDADSHLTKISVPAESPDSRNTAIAVEYDGPVVTDPNAHRLMIATLSEFANYFSRDAKKLGAPCVRDGRTRGRRQVMLGDGLARQSCCVPFDYS